MLMALMKGRRRHDFIPLRTLRILAIGFSIVSLVSQHLFHPIIVIHHISKFGANPTVGMNTYRDRQV